MTDDLRTMVTGQPAPEYPERCRGCGNVPLVVDQNGLHRCREIAQAEKAEAALGEMRKALVRIKQDLDNEEWWDALQTAEIALEGQEEKGQG